MKFEDIPTPAVHRLSFYLRQLEALKSTDRRTISSKQLGESLGYTDAQVRKDLAYFGQFGHPGIGYRVDELISQLRKILGTDKIWSVVLVGAGNLGRALMAYRGFLRKGFQLVAVFDADNSKVGQSFGDLNVLPMSDLQKTVLAQRVRLAVLAVPVESAQAVADQLVAAGVRGILNFAPISVAVPSGTAVQSVDLAVQLEQLSYQMNLDATEPVSPPPADAASAG